MRWIFRHAGVVGVTSMPELCCWVVLGEACADS